MIYLLLTWLAAPWLWWRAARHKTSKNGSILVIQTAKIGDFVATTPVFRALKNQFPESEIVALLHPVNLLLAQNLNSIDRIIELPKTGYKGWAGKRWLLDQIDEGYFAVVVLSPNLTTLLVPFWAGVPQRVSVLPDRRQGSTRLAWPFLTHGEIHRKGRMFRETALRALDGLGITVDDKLLALPNEVVPSSTGADKNEALLGSRSRPFIGLGLGAGNRMKALELAQFEALAVQIIERTPATLVLIGTIADQPAANELLAALPAGRVLDTTGQWNLAELPALLVGLDCFVGVDSGATYLTDAMAVPVVDFMGPADADDQRPIGSHAVIIQSAESCAPCSHAFDAPYSCHLGTRACVRNAPLEQLAESVFRIYQSRHAAEPDDESRMS
jgi:ADP-heptose:LPS heptosyltransferase